MTRRAWLAFLAISLIWGIPYLFIRIAERGGLTPFALTWGSCCVRWRSVPARWHR